DASVAAAGGADRVHEWPVAVVTLGDGAPALDRSGPAATGRIDAAPVEFPIVTAAQRAGDRDDLGEPWDGGVPVDVVDPGTAAMEMVVRERGSQRLMDPTRVLPEHVLRTSMGAAVRGIDVSHSVAVHGVDAIGQGIFRWPDLDHRSEPGTCATSSTARASTKGWGTTPRSS